MLLPSCCGQANVYLPCHWGILEHRLRAQRIDLAQRSQHCMIGCERIGCGFAWICVPRSLMAQLHPDRTNRKDATVFTWAPLSDESMRWIQMGRWRRHMSVHHGKIQPQRNVQTICCSGLDQMQGMNHQDLLPTIQPTHQDCPDCNQDNTWDGSPPLMMCRHLLLGALAQRGGKLLLFTAWPWNNGSFFVWKIACFEHLEGAQINWARGWDGCQTYVSTYLSDGMNRQLSSDSRQGYKAP